MAQSDRTAPPSADICIQNSGSTDRRRDDGETAPGSAHPWLPQCLQGRPLLGLALSFCCGIVLAMWQRPALVLAAILGLVLTAVSLLWLWLRKKARPSFGPLLVAMLGLGFFLASGQLAASTSWPLPAGTWAEVTGRVQGLPLTYLDGGYRLCLRVESVNGEGLRPCRVYAYGEGQPPDAGSTVTLYGETRALRSVGSASAFDYRTYLYDQGLSAQLSVYKGWLRVDREASPLYPLRLCQWLRDGFCAALADLPLKEQALVRGVFLGDTGGLDPATDDGLALAGMLHIFAVSGLHVGYIVLAAAALTRLLRRFLGRSSLRDAAVTLLLLGLYLGLTGAAASVLRALVMVLLVELARILREPLDPISSLSLAALVCLTFRPLWLFTPGFQLSFAAIWSLTVLEPFLARLLGLERTEEGFGAPWYAPFLAALAVSLGTAPFICRDFFYITWWGWLVAPVVVVLAGAAVLLCLAALFGVIWLPGLARLLTTAAAFIMSLLERLAFVLSSRPVQVSYSGLVPPWAWVAAVGLLLTAPLLLRRGRRHWSGLAVVCVLLLLLLPARVQARAAFPVLDGSLSGRALVSVTWLDVGQGDCCLIRTADGHSLLVDGGGLRQSPGTVGYQVVLPYLRSLPLTHLDAAINTHPDLDHTDGLLAVLENIPTGTLVYSAGAQGGLQDELLQAAAANGCQTVAAAAGDSFSFGDYLTLRVLNPPETAEAAVADSDNRASLVLLLCVGESDILLCGDAEADQLEEIAKRENLQVDVLQLPHHGSRSGYSPALYSQLEPEAAIISVGAENSYGHPVAEVVQYWQGRGLYRTDVNGNITLYSDGHGEQLCTYR